MSSHYLGTFCIMSYTVRCTLCRHCTSCSTVLHSATDKLREGERGEKKEVKTIINLIKSSSIKTVQWINCWNCVSCANWIRTNNAAKGSRDKSQITVCNRALSNGAELVRCWFFFIFLSIFVSSHSCSFLFLNCSIFQIQRSEQIL